MEGLSGGGGLTYIYESHPGCPEEAAQEQGWKQGGSLRAESPREG